MRPLPVPAIVRHENELAMADAAQFASVLQRNWEGGLLVARSAANDGRGRPSDIRKNPNKVPLTRFAEWASVDDKTVARYLNAWNLAASDGLVPPADTLEPGGLVDLSHLDAASWAHYYSGKTAPRAAATTPAIPAGQFGCITIDPPWPMAKIVRDVRPAQGSSLDYPTLTLDEIDELVGEVVRAQDNCHVYLWVTQKYLPSGLALLEAWDVKYQCVMTWVKNVGPTPFSWMYDTEHVLFGRRGSLPLEEMGLRLSFTAPTTGHSSKPDVFYDRVAAASPGPRLAMFERAQRPGFIAWGNEVAA